MRTDLGRVGVGLLTKDLVDKTLVKSDAQRAHFERLRQELAVLPLLAPVRELAPLRCSTRHSTSRPDPGHCKGKVHQRATLGYTGRRCLVSQRWSGKTLTDHRFDGRDWFRAVTAGLLDDQTDQTLDAAAHDKPAAKGRYVYMLAKRNDRDVDNYADRIMRSIAARTRARMALRMAQEGSADVPAAPP